jgi:RNA polymerase sigma-70 factor (ECF subfamily)
MIPNGTMPTEPTGANLATTVDLLARARAGDRSALEALFARYGPELTRFARGRLPRWARDMAETVDLVQETLFQTFKQIGNFEWRGEGALRAYMRQALMNRIRDELRRAGRRPAAVPISEHSPDEAPSPLELAIGREGVEKYEAALGRLKDDDREAIIARVEMGLSYDEIAEATGRSTPNAARMAVVRALLRLSEEMADGKPRT